MKAKIVIAIINFIFVLSFSSVIAQTNTTQEAILKTSSPSADTLDENIKSLKDKIATKVAELQKQNKKVIAGLILKKEKDSLELKSEENIYKVAFDDTLTKIYSIINNSQKEIKFEGLMTNDFIIVTGTYIENSINADYIYKDQPYIVGSGKVAEINKDDHSLKVITTEKDEFILDIESYTKQQILDIKNLDINRSGFSKIKEGDVVHFVFKIPAEEKFTRVSALRTLIIPQEYFVKK